MITKTFEQIVEKAEVVVVARKAKKIVPQQDLPAKATKAIKDVSAKTGKVIDWDSPQELLDNTRNPSDLTVKATLLKTFTKTFEQIVEQAKSQYQKDTGEEFSAVLPVELMNVMMILTNICQVQYDVIQGQLTETNNRIDNMAVHFKTLNNQLVSAYTRIKTMQNAWDMAAVIMNEG